MPEVNGSNGEAFEAVVKSRVPRHVLVAVDAIVKERRKSGARVSRADIVRESLTEYFATHTLPAARAEEVAA